MVWNIYKNGPNEASNTNTKLPDLKWQKFPKKIPKMYKMTLKWPKMGKNSLNKWQKEVTIFYFLGHLKAK